MMCRCVCGGGFVKPLQWGTHGHDWTTMIMLLICQYGGPGWCHDDIALTVAISIGSRVRDRRPAGSLNQAKAGIITMNKPRY